MELLIKSLFAFSILCLNLILLLCVVSYRKDEGGFYFESGSFFALLKEKMNSTASKILFPLFFLFVLGMSEYFGFHFVNKTIEKKEKEYSEMKSNKIKSLKENVFLGLSKPQEVTCFSDGDLLVVVEHKSKIMKFILDCNYQIISIEVISDSVKSR